jgi:glycosyltransferase involved in cell wall biosynthesis
MLLTVVLGTYNRKWLLKLAIDSLRTACKGLDYEIIVLDGGSIDGTLDWLREQTGILTVMRKDRDQKGNLIRTWGSFMNNGFRMARGKYICMISDDCIIHEDAVKNGIELMEAPGNEKVGACAFLFRDYPKDNAYKVCYVFGHAHVNHGLFRRKVGEELGWMDEKNYLFFAADGDFSLRIWQAGYTISISKGSFIEHYKDTLYDFIRIKNIRSSVGQQGDPQKLEGKWKEIFGSRFKHSHWESYESDNGRLSLGFQFDFKKPLSLKLNKYRIFRIFKRALRLTQ